MEDLIERQAAAAEDEKGRLSMKMPMTKTSKNSHFELVNGEKFTRLGNRVLQVYPEKVYTGPNGYAVFLCEVENEKEE